MTIRTLLLLTMKLSSHRLTPEPIAMEFGV